MPSPLVQPYNATEPYGANSSHPSHFSSTIVPLEEDATFTRFTQPVWIIAEVCNVAGLLAVTWVSVSFVHYGLKTGKFASHRHKKCGCEANAGPVYKAALVALLSSYVRLFADQAAFNVGYDPGDDHRCEIALDASAIGYFLSLICVYAFLWLKQRSLYQHPGLRRAHFIWLKVISWSSITLICSGVLVAGVIFVKSVNFVASPHGCVARPTEAFTIWPMVLLCAVLTMGQLMMLFLFVYPLRKQGESCRTERVTRMFRRAALFALVCVVSDVLALTVLEFAVIGHFTRHMVLLAYEYNMLVNLGGVLLSFEFWHTILLSPLCCASSFSSPSHTSLAIAAASSTAAGTAAAVTMKNGH